MYSGKIRSSLILISPKFILSSLPINLPVQVFPSISKYLHCLSQIEHRCKISGRPTSKNSSKEGRFANCPAYLIINNSEIQFEKLNPYFFNSQTHPTII